MELNSLARTSAYFQPREEKKTHHFGFDTHLHSRRDNSRKESPGRFTIKTSLQTTTYPLESPHETSAMISEADLSAYFKPAEELHQVTPVVNKQRVTSHKFSRGSIEGGDKKLVISGPFTYSVNGNPSSERMAARIRSLLGCQDINHREQSTLGQLRGTKAVRSSIVNSFDEELTAANLSFLPAPIRKSTDSLTRLTLSPVNSDKEQKAAKKRAISVPRRPGLNPAMLYYSNKHADEIKKPLQLAEDFRPSARNKSPANNSHELCKSFKVRKMTLRDSSLDFYCPQLKVPQRILPTSKKNDYFIPPLEKGLESPSIGYSPAKKGVVVDFRALRVKSNANRIKPHSRNQKQELERDSLMVLSSKQLEDWEVDVLGEKTVAANSTKNGFRKKLFHTPKMPFSQDVRFQSTGVNIKRAII